MHRRKSILVGRKGCSRGRPGSGRDSCYQSREEGPAAGTAGLGPSAQVPARGGARAWRAKHHAGRAFLY